MRGRCVSVCAKSDETQTISNNIDLVKTVIAATLQMRQLAWQINVRPPRDWWSAARNRERVGLEVRLGVKVTANRHAPPTMGVILEQFKCRNLAHISRQ